MDIDYQDIVNMYKKNIIDISGLKKGLEVAKPLSGRPRYRAVRLSGENARIYMRTLDITRAQETPKNVQHIQKEIVQELERYFDRLVQSMKECRAWKITGLVAQDYTMDMFKTLAVSEKVKMLKDLNNKYTRFLEIQKIADIRDCVFTFKNLSQDEDKLKKICFLTLMFKKFSNKDIIREFYIFDKSFLNALIEYKKDKKAKDSLDSFMGRKRKSTYRDFQKYSKYFSQEDFRELADNITLTARTLKVPNSSVIEAYSEMSETEAEIAYLSSDITILDSLEEKYNAMEVIRLQDEKEREVREVAKIEEEKRRNAEEELEKRRKEAADRLKKKEQLQRNRVLGKNEGQTPFMEAKIKEIQNTTTAKEQVNPLIFAWFEKEDITLTRRVGSKKLTEFFDKIKRIEAETGIRVSLYLITNSGREVTVKRLEEIQKKAKAAGLPRLVEGALGGYSAFRVDSDKRITALAKMSQENRKKISTLLSRSMDFPLTQDLIESEEIEYLRYQFTDKRDKSIDKKYLNFAVNRILSDPRISKQPLKFLPYIENKKAGIDVVLESQLKGVSQLPEYYKSKYYVAPGKTMKVSIDDIDSFLGKANNRDGEEHE